MGGDVRNQGDNRTKNRISTTVPRVIILVALTTCIVGVPLYFYLTATQSVQNPCHEGLSVPLLNPIFHPNGSAEEDGEVYPSGYHFAQNGTTRGCLCVLKPCIRKCCGRDEHFVKVPGKRSKCEKTSGPFPFEHFSLPVHKAPGERVKVDQNHFRIMYGDICLHGKFILDPEKNPEDKHDLMVDGRFRYVDGNHLDISKYCLESMNGSEQIRTFLCFPDNTVDDATELQRQLYPIAIIVSIPFLAATIFVYTVLPALRNLHGKSLVCQCSSLLVTHIALAIIQLKGTTIDNCWCVILAFTVQFAFLGAFFWLNVMSFDIWWTFSGLRPPQWGLKVMEQKKFLLYSLYAWGVPLLIVAVSLAMDFIPSAPNSFIKPDFGKLKCWFADWKGTFLYFYLPSGILLVLNFLMFIATAVKVRAITKNDQDQDRFRLYVRLFFVMGLNWTVELVSFFVGGPKSLWLVTDICNALQGVIIFVFFVCKQNILKKLNKKLCPSWKIFKETNVEHSKSLSSSISLNKIENVDVLDLKTVESPDSGNNENL